MFRVKRANMIGVHEFILADCRSQPELIAHLVRVKTHALHPADHDPGGIHEAKRSKSSDGRPCKRPEAGASSPSIVSVKENIDDEELACSGGDEGGLAGLLGNYDSSSDGEEEEEEESTQGDKCTNSKPSPGHSLNVEEGCGKKSAKRVVATQGSPVDPGDFKGSKESLEGGNPRRLSK